MKIVLLGGSGYVGRAFQRYFASRQADCQSLTRRELDYYDAGQLAGYLNRARPDFLINTAGYTGKPNVDACETDRANCLLGNAVLPGKMAEACGEAGVLWGHVSSGCIFTGRRGDGNGFREEDPPNFSFRTNHCSFYSGTKALGEETLGYEERANNRILQWLPRIEPTGYIWRLRIPFDKFDGPRNYLTKVMRYERLLDAENSLSHLGEFVRACFETFERGCPYGIYNVTNPGSVSTRQVTRWIQEAGEARARAGLSNPFPDSFQFFDDEEEFMEKAAATPRSNCVLDTTKLQDAGIRLRPIDQAIRETLDDWVREAE